MKFLNRIVLVLLFISLSVSLSAQEFLWSVGVDMMFDNREYGKSKYNWPQTIFGGYINPLVGIGWRGNSIQAGVSAMRNFGAPTKDMDVNFVFFYNYRDHRFNVSAGIIPRRQVIGGSEAFFCDSIKFFDNTIDGLLLQFIPDEKIISKFSATGTGIRQQRPGNVLSYIRRGVTIRFRGCTASMS